MKKFYLPLVATTLLLAFALTVAAAPRPKMFFTGDASSRWTNASNWTLNSGSSGGAGRIPQSGDSIVITNGQTAYIAPISGMPTVVLSNVIIVVQRTGVLQIGNGSGNEGTLTLDINSAISLERTGSNRGKVTANPNNSSNKITINSVVKFQGNLVYTTNTGSGTGVVTGSAHATVNTGSGVNGFTLGTLPVVLVGFNANLTSDNKVNVQWTTQQEISTDHFDIQRSSDGLNWQTIATVKAAGFSSIQKSYSIQDIAPQSGTNLYRLQMIDFDANFGFSSVVNVRLSLLGKVSIFPNPTVSTMNVSLGHAPTADWSLSLINQMGQTVVRKIFGKGITTVSLPVGHIPTGNYTVEINDGFTTQSSKLLIAH